MWFEEYLKKEFMLLFIAFFLLNMLVVAVSITQGIEASIEEANQTMQIISELDISIESIFINNIVLTLIMLIPIMGIAFNFIVMHNTGLVTGHIAKAYGITLPQMFLIFFTEPIVYLEFSAIALALAEATYIVYLVFVRREELKNRFKYSMLSVTLITSILFLGAVIEYYMLVIK